MPRKHQPKQTRFVRFDATLEEELTRALRRNKWTIELIRKACGNPSNDKDLNGKHYDDDWLKQFRQVLTGRSLIISKEELRVIEGYAGDGCYNVSSRA